jgi:hypothetical protein
VIIVARSIDADTTWVEFRHLVHYSGATTALHLGALADRIAI